MTRKVTRHLMEIQRRVRYYQQRKQRRINTALAASCAFLLLSLGNVMARLSVSPGVSAVTDAYGSVLLHDGADTYIMVAIAAFVLGVAVTMLCLWKKRRKAALSKRHAEKEKKEI